jgi:uncharacterized protein
MIMNMARRDDDYDDDDEPMQSFSAITPTRCAELLSSQSVGRVAWQGRDGLQILPVTYVYSDGRIVFRTSPDSVLSALSSPSDVVFEVDDLDQRTHRGWSVVARGQAQAVGESQQLDRPLTDAGVVPWAPGDRNVLIEITPERMTGRTVSAR